MRARWPLAKDCTQAAQHMDSWSMQGLSPVFRRKNQHTPRDLSKSAFICVTDEGAWLKGLAGVKPLSDQLT